MRIIGGRRATYLYVSGIGVKREIELGSGLTLLPAKLSCSPNCLRCVMETAADFHIASLIAPSIGSQLKVCGKGSRDVAMKSWNATWDVLLLGAMFAIEADSVLHSATDARRITSKSAIFVTHYHIRQFAFTPGYVFDDNCISILEKRFPDARNLMLKEKQFQNAIHCLATYRWHTQPRAQLALLWSGIEGLFSIDSELSFRISLYAAKFLHPNDASRATKEFKLVRRLYAQRSKAVHGGEMKGDPHTVVSDSARLLLSLVIECVARQGIPQPEDLAP